MGEGIEQGNAFVSEDKLINKIVGRFRGVSDAQFLIGSCIGILVGMVVGFADVGANSSKAAASAKVNFPNTEFDKFEMRRDFDLVQAEAGETVLYFHPNGDYVFVGDVINLKSKVNLTQERRDALAGIVSLEKDLIGGGKSPSAVKSEPAAAPSRAALPSAPPAANKVDLSAITPEHYVVKGQKGGRVIYVVADFNCGFCKRLDVTLAQMSGFEIREIPVGYLGQQSLLKGAAVLCSDDPAKASDDMYRSQSAQISTCSQGEAQMQLNTAWAQAQGIGGTPAIIDESGRVLPGARPAPDILAFLGES